MWWIRGRIDPERLIGWTRTPAGAGISAAGRTVLHVRVPDARRTRFWFVITPGDVSLCFTDPGFDVDVTLEASLSVLYQVWLGVLTLPTALRDGRVSMTGPREPVRRLPDALRLSPVAPFVRSGRVKAVCHGPVRVTRSGTPLHGPVVWHTARVIHRTGLPYRDVACPGCCRCCCLHRHS